MLVVTLEGRKSLKNNELNGLNSSKNTIGLAYFFIGCDACSNKTEFLPLMLNIDTFPIA